MQIKEILRQHRRDFTAIYKCEGCGTERESVGYDDRYFHDEVIPTMGCHQCGKSSRDMGTPATHTPTRYPEGMQV